MDPDQASCIRRWKKASCRMSCWAFMAMSMGSQRGMDCRLAAAEMGADRPANRSSNLRVCAGGSSWGSLTAICVRSAGRLQVMFGK